MPRIIATIQARMGSERLPGKHLLQVAGHPLIWHLIERVKLAKNIHGIVVAMPDTAQNNELETFCKNTGAAVFRGSEDDVLGRMVGALEQEGADIGVEIYGDGSLIDARIIDECIEKFLQEGVWDFVGNDLKHTFPSGMFCETFTVASLKDSAAKTNDPAIREHGTLFIRQHPEIYKICNIDAVGMRKRPDVHLDVDTADDLAVIEAIVSEFAPRLDFTLEEIVEFLDKNPDIRKKNEHVHRRWKQYQPD
jgi:spore coat polysaccharide biosynthesis protein SpsF (cytidylyltransferase family)